MEIELLSKIPYIVFFIAIIVYAVLSFIIIYHLIRFGVGNEPKVVSLVFFGGSLVILLFVVTYFFNIF